MNESERNKAVEKAKARLSRNGIRFRDEPQKPKVVWVNGSPGIKVWGAVDCLTKHGGFTLIRNGEAE